MADESDPRESARHAPAWAAASPVKMHIVSIQVGSARDYRSSEAGGVERPWRSAILKSPVMGAVAVGPLGVQGDTQVDRRHHGGPHRALLAYSAESYARWRTEGGLPDFPCGAFGENLMLAGVDEDSVCIGDIYRMGDVRVEVSQPRQPCVSLARRWQMPDLPERVRQTGRSGWYMRVLQPGLLEAGQPFEREANPHPEWSVTRAAQVMRARLERPAEAAALASLPALSPGWRATLLRAVG
jgi:MOSC domain-containing protein YiiM